MTKSRRAFIKSAGVVGALAAGNLKTVSASEPELKPNCIAATPGKFRCVVTGQNKSGKSVIVSHAPVQPVTVAMMPGYEFFRIWGSDSKYVLPSDDTATQPTFFPPPSGFRFGMFILPPAATASAMVSVHPGSPPPPNPAELEEMKQKLPGALEALEADHPGMHTTDTVDFDVVIFGEVVLELDEGAEVLLKAGDCVIQNGTRHAWHNRSSERCPIAFSLLGADRKRTALKQLHDEIIGHKIKTPTVSHGGEDQVVAED